MAVHERGDNPCLKVRVLDQIYSQSQICASHECKAKVSVGKWRSRSVEAPTASGAGVLHIRFRFVKQFTVYAALLHIEPFDRSTAQRETLSVVQVSSKS